MGKGANGECGIVQAPLIPLLFKNMEPITSLDEYDFTEDEGAFIGEAMWFGELVGPDSVLLRGDLWRLWPAPVIKMRYHDTA